jgi:hypothetical protein
MSSIYQFKKFRDPKNPHSITEVTMEVQAEDLPSIIEEFELFLKASGFCFDGHLDIVEEES